MKICVLVKDVPDAAVQKRIDPGTMRLDRSGENTLNPFDTHAFEAAMQLKEEGKLQVDEIVAVTMGTNTAQRALQKAVALGADRSVHLADEALAGSDVCATGLALAKLDGTARGGVVVALAHRRAEDRVVFDQKDSHERIVLLVPHHYLQNLSAG